MKSSMLLLLLALGLAFAAGYVSLQITQNPGESFRFSLSEIAQVKRQFREKTSALAEIKTTGLFPAESGLELIDPRTSLNSYKPQTYSQVSAVFKALKTCKPDLIKDRALQKMKVWVSYRCGFSHRLPKDFFARPPFVSSLGRSFASLAYNLPEFKNEQWLEAHIPVFHVLELQEIPIKLDPTREILRELNPEELLAITSGQNWISTRLYILVKRTSELPSDFRHSQPTIDYLVYSKIRWDSFIASFNAQTKPGALCAVRDDGLCWSRIRDSAESKIRWTLGGLFAFALILVLFCSAQILRILKSQKRQEEKKRFALQALTHELRTPLSSLVISSEHVLSQFDELPQDCKESILRMANDVQRLNRVAQSSRHYLTANNSKSLVPFDFVRVPSINAFVCSTLEDYSDQILITPLAVDEPFTLDTYWMSVCLQNLVQNACQHGLKPVTVKLQKKNRSLVVSVSDQGQIDILDRSKILKPFFKRAKSSGIGLGLTIVETITKSMNAKLKISFAPTTFEIWLEEAT